MDEATSKAWAQGPLHEFAKLDGSKIMLVGQQFARLVMAALDRPSTEIQGGDLEVEELGRLNVVTVRADDAARTTFEHPDIETSAWVLDLAIQPDRIDGWLYPMAALRAVADSDRIPVSPSPNYSDEAVSSLAIHLRDVAEVGEGVTVAHALQDERWLADWRLDSTQLMAIWTTNLAP